MGTATLNPTELTLIPVVPGVRYYVTDGDSMIGTVNKAYRRDGFYADRSSVLFETPQAAAASMAPPAVAVYESEQDEHFCGSVTCDGGCHERAVEQFDRGQM